LQLDEQNPPKDPEPEGQLFEKYILKKFKSSVTRVFSTCILSFYILNHLNMSSLMNNNPRWFLSLLDNLRF
jgi:hypothetical protein